MKKISIYVGFFVCFIAVHINAFDHIYYLSKNNIKVENNDFRLALNHYYQKGCNQGLQTSATQIDNTNFDWEYYVERNGLTEIKSEQAAYGHYQRYGKWQKLAYCKQFDIVILLHLYDLDIMDEMIGRINYFIKNNPLNTYRIKINVPVDTRILKEINFYGGDMGIKADDAAFFLRDKAAVLGAEHKELMVSPDYSPILYNMYHYLQKAFVLEQDKIQIVFSENRGMDIGGFFVLLDELKKENKPFDFLVKVHTKGNKVAGSLIWRSLLVSFLNIKINRVLRMYDVIYSCRLHSIDDPVRYEPIFIEKSTKLWNFFGMKLGCPYDFCGGTMFVAPYAFFDFVHKWDFSYLYSATLIKGYNSAGYEHSFERLFGYIFSQMSSKVLCLDYIPRACEVKYDV